MAGRIGVLGAGGMGTAFAAHLARAGHDVVLIGRGSAHVRALATGPLWVKPPTGPPWSVAVPVAAHADDVAPGSLDVLLLLTKAYDLAGAARSAAHVLAPGGVAIPLQNGLGTDVPVAHVFGGGAALVGTTTVGAALAEPGRITVSVSTAAGDSLTSIGPMGHATAEAGRGTAVAAALTAAGLPTASTPAVAELIWGKLALAAMSPLSSVLRVTVATVWSSAAGRALVQRMFDEVVAVAAAEGVALDRDAAWAHATRTFAGTGEHYTSMCTDVRRGRPTELSSMGGAVRALGERHGVPVPAHAAVVDLLGLAGVR
ncbi:ketopantoate reductase family protein [Pseudonocardia sp. GCM10023141]|uniref:ketopantoate reductase family protein n=1 Tax=Pseudonocardia sp. GCM10023141 TaxID=3252653 RepID=UPI00361392B7